MLPLPKKAPKILVAGSHADNLGYQCGGWTTEWQGLSGNNLTEATGVFSEANIIGEGGFGKVFKGRLGTGEIVAIKKLNQGVQGSQEFIIDVFMLSLLHHPNLMGLKDYCTDGYQKLLVYEYMPQGRLEDHLFGDPSIT